MRITRERRLCFETKIIVLGLAPVRVWNVDRSNLVGQDHQVFLSQVRKTHLPTHGPSLPFSIIIFFLFFACFCLHFPPLATLHANLEQATRMELDNTLGRFVKINSSVSMHWNMTFSWILLWESKMKEQATVGYRMDASLVHSSMPLIWIIIIPKDQKPELRMSL